MENEGDEQNNDRNKFRKGFQKLLKKTNSMHRNNEQGPPTTPEKMSPQPSSHKQSPLKPSPQKHISPKKREREPQEVITLPSDSDEEKIISPKKKRSKHSQSDGDDEKEAGEPLKSLQLTVFIVVRGDITDRIYKTWLVQLPKKLTEYHITIGEDYHGENNCLIVVSPNLIAPTFTAWLGNEKLGEGVNIISSEWVINAIKHSSFPPLEEFLVNPMDNQPFEVNKDQNDNIGEGSPGKKLANTTSSSGAGAFHPSYACVNTGDFKTLNPNKYITDILEELQSIYELVGDEWRALGYKKVVGTLKQLPRITNIDQLKGVRGIGDSIREKIEEILKTGKLKKLKYFQDDPKIQSLVALAKVWGIGEKTALKLMKMGYKSIKDLREKGQAHLTYQQKIGLKYYEEFQLKIPRAEIEEIRSIVREHCSR
jgi:hypothetical protein